MIRILSKGPEQTAQIGATTAAFLRGGCAVALIGELGAGKTVFVQGIASQLGYTGTVTSPTFTLVHQYDTNPVIFHLDCFRLRSPRDFASVGIEEYQRPDSVLIVEWADLIADYVDQWCWRVQFEYGADALGDRVIRIDRIGQHDNPTVERNLLEALKSLGVQIL
ncbi:MAG: tRNA (adenosine(37)-N6)-threonylcarbamoyltransferase complex ATPase subunit type 1 TsaE [bacterium]|nr:tRNA (adenosine(37)-N6)-threonylcarbamoyltransferase complex ATPase subunit type 1 TsaE [bacterium]